MNCKHCGNTAHDIHHIIPKGRNKGGTNHPLNLIPLCRTCHNAFHDTCNTKLQKEVKDTCYNQIKENLTKCYKSKRGYIPKIIRELEYEMR